MNYFVAYTYTMGTGEIGTGSLVMSFNREIKDQRDLNLAVNTIRESEFEKGTNIAIVIINFIKL